MDSHLSHLRLVFFVCFLISFPLPLFSNNIPIHPFIITKESNSAFSVQQSIIIDGNHDLRARNWPGDGSFLSPYLIENYSIEVSEVGAICIEIKNTNQFFSIQNCVLRGSLGTTGISLTNVTNGFVTQTEILTQGTGLTLNSTTNMLINNNTIREAEYGLVLHFTSSLDLSENSLVNNYRAICSYSSTNNIISRNTITHSPSGGYGLDFHFTNYTLIANNSILFQNYGFYSEYSSHINFTSNIFFRNYLKAIFLSEFGTSHIYVFSNDFYTPVKDVTSGSRSQATDNGQENIFSHNYWSEWISPDDDNNGIIDIPYLLSGFARNHDFFPLPSPTISSFTPPLTSTSSGWFYFPSLLLIIVIVLIRRKFPI